jgi:hypothetical protein
MSHRRQWWIIDPAAANAVVAWLSRATIDTARGAARRLARTMRRNLKLTDHAPRATPPRGTRRRSSPKPRGRRRSSVASRPAVKRRRRRNPGVPQLNQAAQMFRRFHGFDPKTVTSVAGERSIPRTLVRLGDLVEVSYRSNKFDRKTRDYVHKFGTPRPTLCTRPDGSGLFIVGGRFRNTARGIVG